MTERGVVIAQGRTSEVYAFGAGSVVKVPRPGVPPHWARVEAEIADAVHSAGLPVPEVRGLAEVDGREAVVFERITGPPMWEVVVERPDGHGPMIDLLAEIQAEIHRARPPSAVPQLRNRIASKILAAEGLSDLERQDAYGLLASLAPGASLCHGDLHPANVLMSPDGPKVIDWFDAAVGAPAADVVRTSLLLRPPSGSRSMPVHLPGARPGLLARIHERYLGQILLGPDSGSPVGTGSARFTSGDLLRWERVLAAGRLAEHTTTDRADLLALWRSGDQVDPSRLAVSELARVLDRLVL